MVFKLDFPLCVTNGRTEGQTDGHTLLKRCKNASKKKTDMQACKCVCHYKKVQNCMHVCQYCTRATYGDQPCLIILLEIK